MLNNGHYKYLFITETFTDQADPQKPVNLSCFLSKKEKIGFSSYLIRICSLMVIYNLMLLKYYKIICKIVTLSLIK